MAQVLSPLQSSFPLEASVSLRAGLSPGEEGQGIHTTEIRMRGELGDFPNWRVSPFRGNIPHCCMHQGVGLVELSLKKSLERLFGHSLDFLGPVSFTGVYLVLYMYFAHPRTVWRWGRTNYNS